MLSKTAGYACIVLYLCTCSRVAESGNAGFHEVPRNCEEWRWRGVLDQTYYLIDPDQEGPLPPFQVRCDMTKKPAFDIVEHNISSRTEVVSAPNPPNGLDFNVVYQNVTMDQIKALIAIEAHCFQHLKYDCHGSLITDKGIMTAYVYSRDKKKMAYWPGGPPSGIGCACGMNRSCAGGAGHLCNCEKNDEVWRSDEGNVTDMNALPITKLFFTDTDGAKEQGFFSLGSLKCQGRPAERAERITFSRSCGRNTRGNQELLMLSVDSSRGKQCMGWSGLDYNSSATNYHLSFFMMADMTAAAVAGNPGVVFNMRNQHNYDLVFLRLHSTKDCYEYGYVEDGRYHNVLSGSCSYISRPSYHKWLQVRVEVTRNSAKLYFNKDYLVDINPHHRSVPRGGVLALNGNNFFVLARDFKLSSVDGTFPQLSTDELLQRSKRVVLCA